MFTTGSTGRVDVLNEFVPARHATSALATRPVVKGKFLYLGEDKLLVKGATYGTFESDPTWGECGSPDVVDRDFATMAANGFNAIRTYTVPPCWLLDAAARYGLFVMVGLPWEQHVTFLDDRERARSIVDRVRAGVRACASHPAVLCYVIGNEIPAAVVRWHGRRRIERFLEGLHRAAKSEDPDGLVSYVNYPTTEYLDLPFLDLVCFNVYLETQEALAAYLARLQNLAGECPLLMAEIGLDSRRHGERAQARALNWQIRTAFAAGCAGAFVFAWTDEWHRGGHDIEDWDFGLTTRDRRPKPALTAVRDAFGDVPFPRRLNWPRMSVVVCSYNGARTIRDCFEGLVQLQYPDYEVIVVNDGSTDETAEIAEKYGFRLISIENRGLSNARNTGLAAATGAIVAYIDDDARPDPHWLSYLALAFLETTHVGVGGPNIAPPGDGTIAECVANAPGGPVHVLLSDREAEHIPGCNMAFRKAALEAIGGFDPRFRAAGDDVDVCWRLQERGWTLGFSPAAVVWHHRRNSLRAYWKQQCGYGKAEALLENKWPSKYNAAGHLAWSGRLYGKGITRALSGFRDRIYQGTWGSAPFQSVYERAPGTVASLTLMPEWYLVVTILAALSVLGNLWSPLLVVAMPLLGLAIAASIGQAALGAVAASFAGPPASRLRRLGARALVAVLHLVQPAARLWGRLRNGLTPWRQRGVAAPALPRPRTEVFWSERWTSAEARVGSVEAALQDLNATTRCGGDFDPWDLEVRGGLLAGVRVRVVVEEHGAGRQLIRVGLWPRCALGVVVGGVLFGVLGWGAALSGAWAAAVVLGGGAVLFILRAIYECSTAMGSVLRALGRAGIGRAIMSTYGRLGATVRMREAERPRG
jgi:GT2 family glycosyltransferase